MTHTHVAVNSANACFIQSMLRCCKPRVGYARVISSHRLIISSRLARAKSLYGGGQTPPASYAAVHIHEGMTMIETRTLNSCSEVLRNMVSAMRSIFSPVDVLVRLLLVNPSSSATAKRSFNSLHRSSCGGQRRLNSSAMCHVQGVSTCLLHGHVHTEKMYVVNVQQ